MRAKIATLNQMGRGIRLEPSQLALPFPAPPRRKRRGGWRRRAGRKASPERKGLVKHVARPELSSEDPVHVVVRVVRDVPYLRTQRIWAALQRIFARASEKGLRLLHFSVQANHLHMIVEATHEGTLGRGMKRLLSRIAMTINAIARRSGRVFRDRYFRQDILSCTHYRNLLVYVLFNARKHDTTRDWRNGIDTYSSTDWFHDWAPGAGPPPRDAEAIARAGPPLVVEPRSWVAKTGWKLHGGGLLRLDDAIAS
jgi:REP element-mobilizing transposase RayT